MAIALVVVAALVQPAAATVIGGMVTEYMGVRTESHFVKLKVPFDESDPANTVGYNTFQQSNLYAFDEDQNLLLTADVRVDVGASPKAGEIVASHYVFFDPMWGSRQVGYVDFDATIYGVATSTENLEASDFLANTGVIYFNPGLRGLEGNDRVWIDPDDPRRLWVEWVAETPGDYVRVFTMESPLAAVPAPSAAARVFPARFVPLWR